MHIGLGFYPYKNRPLETSEIDDPKKTNYNSMWDILVTSSILDNLEANPTPENLDQLMQQNPLYKLEEKNSCGQTALYTAIHSRSLPLIKHILGKNSEFVNSGYGLKNTPYLNLAVSIANPDVALAVTKELVTRGANVNLSDCNGYTSLFNSSLRKTHIEVTKFLLNQGAIIDPLAVQHILREGKFHSNGKNLQNQFYVELIKSQSVNLKRAIDELLGARMFLKGQIHSNRTESLLSVLPAEIRKIIFDYAENKLI